MARAIRDLAGELGMSSLAGVQVASLKRNIARWESAGVNGSMGERNQLLLAHLYARTPAGEISIGGGSDFEALLSALHHFGIDEDRLRELQAAVAENAARQYGGLSAFSRNGYSPDLARALHDPSKLSHGTLVELREVVTDVNNRVGTVPFVRLQLQLAPTVDSCRRLIAATDTPGSLREDLLVVASDAFTLAGRLAFETRDDDASSQLYGAATDAASKVTDSRHLAAVYTSHAMVTHYISGVPNSAREIAHAAVKAAEVGSSISVRARALAVQAEMSARAGLHRETEVALLRAWKTVDRDTVDDPSGDFNHDRLNGFEGVCQLHIGRAEVASERIERCITSLQDPRSKVQLGINTTDLAIARQRLGDPRASVALLHESVDIAAGTGGRVASQRIRQARLELRKWRTESFVADLDDHIHATLLAR
ncbi:hypothetical protein BKA01_003629 [Pseudonocardia eucalypti]|nr:hypothetical protein [Pseudonocardia eucalypti]